jgi:membrane glycosyltransferase
MISLPVVQLHRPQIGGPRCTETAPALTRGSMVPEPWVGLWRGLGRGLISLFQPGVRRCGPVAAWEQAAAQRRRTLVILVLLASAMAGALLVQCTPSGTHPLLRAVQIGLYSLLFAWVSAGFFTALMGAWVLWRGDAHALSVQDVAHQPVPPEARTAIVMPICNEHVPTVFAGLRATCESLASTGAAQLFEVFVLSDTSKSDVRDEELAAWRCLQDELGDSVRVHYRWRQRRTRRKAGNVADFCRRWGRSYRYMVVLDADSVMSGDCLVTLVRLMEAHPRAGIIQTAPQACGQETLHARAQQFASRVTGRLFTVGMQYWQLGESHYWGHNAILRVQPFMEHCALAPLPGRGGLSGDILSHDFVEAALMRRAGWQVWLVPDLQGSYEQVPSNLLEELQRDRRWCQGNLQNAQLIAEPGLHAVHRAMLATGAMAYLSAPLWLAFVCLGSLLWALGGGQLAVPSLQLAGLWSASLAMLLLPRFLGVVLLLGSPQRRRYGGTWALLGGALLEMTLSALQAPVRMVAHSLFVLAAITGLKLDWKSPAREAALVPWREAGLRFGMPGLAALCMLTLLWRVDMLAALWLMPIAVPLLLAVPMCVMASHGAVGCWVRRYGLLLTPEEAWVPTVLRRAKQHARAAALARSRLSPMITTPVEPAQAYSA